MTICIVKPLQQGSVQQHHSHDDRGAERSVRRHAVASYELVRRGARASVRVQRARSSQHADHHPAGDGHHESDRPVGRLVHDGVAHGRDVRRSAQGHRRDRGDGRHGERHRSGHSQAQDRRVRRQEAGAHRQRQGRHRGREQLQARQRGGHQRAHDRQYARARVTNTQAQGDTQYARRERRALGARRDHALLPEWRRQPARVERASGTGTRHSRRDHVRHGACLQALRGQGQPRLGCLQGRVRQ